MQEVPREIGSTLKLLCLNASWHAANMIKGYSEDAAASKQKFQTQLKKLKSASGVSELLSLDLIEDLAAMFMNAAWHASYARLGWGKDKSAAEAKGEFEQRYLSVKESGEFSEDLCNHLKWMCWNCSWFAANTRAGNEKDAAKDKVGYLRHARACVGDIHRGVHLGGWLVLHREMCATAFAGVPEQDAMDEFALCTHLGPEAAARRLKTWRDTFIRRDDIQEIAQAGFNSVRLPFGYWCLEGLETLGLRYHPFVGPCMEYIDDAVEWCREARLSLVLDLHAAPGFQNKSPTCGRTDETWEVSARELLVYESFRLLMYEPLSC